MAAGMSLEDIWESVWSSRKGLEFYIPSKSSVYWGQDVEETKHGGESLGVPHGKKTY